MFTQVTAWITIFSHLFLLPPAILTSWKLFSFSSGNHKKCHHCSGSSAATVSGQEEMGEGSAAAKLCCGSLFTACAGGSVCSSIIHPQMAFLSPERRWNVPSMPESTTCCSQNTLAQTSELTIIKSEIQGILSKPHNAFPGAFNHAEAAQKHLIPCRVPFVGSIRKLIICDLRTNDISAFFCLGQFSHVTFLGEYHRPVHFCCLQWNWLIPLQQ